jgi:hypothetical protein
MVGDTEEPRSARQAEDAPTGEDLVDYDALDYQGMLDRAAARKRTLLIAVAAGVLLAGGGTVYALQSMEATQRAAVDAAWSRASACLVGPPVATPAEAVARIRNTQLAVVGLTAAERAHPGEPGWPRSCTRAMHGVAEALKNGGQPEAPLVASATKLATALDQSDSDLADLAVPIEDTWTQAVAAGLRPTAIPADVTPPPQPVTPLDQDGVARYPRLLPGMIRLERLETQATPGARLVFLIDDKSQPNLPAVCTAFPDQLEVRCRSLPRDLTQLSPGLRLWGSADEAASPFLFAGNRGTAGIFRQSDGKRIAEGMSFGASALADGSLVRTVWKEEKQEVWFAVHRPDGKTRESRLLEKGELGNPYYSSGLFWDWLVYKGVRHGDTILLMARRVTPGGDLDPETVIGALPQPSLVEGEELAHISACRMPEAFVLRVKGVDEQYTAFFSGGRWTPPVESVGTGGALTCYGGEAVITKLVTTEKSGKIAATVQQNRCTPASCISQWITFQEMLKDVPHLAPIDRDHVTAAELGGKLLVLWGAGERGGLRMRLAPVGQLYKARDRVIYDDLVEEGKPAKTSTLLETRLLSGGTWALLFLSTGKGVYVLQVGADGKLQPVRTRFD